MSESEASKHHISVRGTNSDGVELEFKYTLEYPEGHGFDALVALREYAMSSAMTFEVTSFLAEEGDQSAIEALGRFHASSQSGLT